MKNLSFLHALMAISAINPGGWNGLPIHTTWGHNFSLRLRVEKWATWQLLSYKSCDSGMCMHRESIFLETSGHFIGIPLEAHILTCKSQLSHRGYWQQTGIRQFLERKPSWPFCPLPTAHWAFPYDQNCLLSHLEIYTNLSHICGP